MRVSDTNAETRASHLEVARPHERLSPVEPPPAQIGRKAVGKPVHIDDARARTDSDRLTRGESDELLLDQEPCEDADAVAAHLRDAAVGIRVVHEPLGIFVGLEKGAPLGDAPRAHGSNDPVGADAKPSISQSRALRRVELERPVGVGHQDEVVAGAVALGESQRHHSPMLTASSSATRRSTWVMRSSAAAFSTSIDASRRNQLTCRRAYRRVND